PKRKWDPKFELMLETVSREPSRHQFGRNSGQYYFSMVPNVITVGVGDESRRLFIPRVQPKIYRR
ncbi:MAG TPA: hypothetical protein VFO40_05520, partial [Chthoniobacterales bacterium]|nr:hypothetical protein [Chthoniobacterales bacterium]